MQPSASKLSRQANTGTTCWSTTINDSEVTVEEEISLSKSDEVNSISLNNVARQWSRLRFGSNLTSPSKVTNSEPSVKTNPCSPLMF
ncbi:hypothetical protein OH492_09200 [Vibrio chagasii]|nr:hypothetical protein [Vibrio chagasii]